MKILFIIFLFPGCAGLFIPKPSLSQEYLAFNEKILIDYYSGKSEREKSIDVLEKVCESGDNLGCYNLSALYFLEINWEKSNLFALKASLKKSDWLYSSIERQSALNLKKQTGSGSERSKNLLKLEILCREKRKEEVENLARLMVEDKSITLSLLRRGFISDCLEKSFNSELEKKALSNKANLSKAYKQEKAKSNRFYSVWGTNDDKLTELAKFWTEFKDSVKSKNNAKAASDFKNFLNEISKETKSSNEKRLLFYLRRAAYLLIEQDELFKDFRFLLKEFGDKF